MIHKKTIEFLQFQLPFLAWCVFIYTVSTIPQTRIPNLVNYSDKIVHFGVFCTLCWLAHIAFYFQSIRLVKEYSLFLAFCFVVLFGFSDEYHQMFTPGRSSEVWDLLADTAGALFYCILYTRFRFYERAGMSV